MILARGRSQRELSAADTELAYLKGPTGNYRVPILLVGSTLVVGFSSEALAELGLG